MALEIYSREKQGVVILDARGNIDISASEFIETVGWHLANRRLDILCDFKQIDMIDYAGLSVLTIAYKNAVNHNGRMKFCNVPLCVRAILQAVMLDRIFEIYLSEELALNAFKEDREIDKIQHMQLRRRFKRVELNVPACYSARYGNTGTVCEGEILDLSGEGAFIFGGKTFALKDIIKLEFKLPRIGKVQTDAKVVWLTDKEIQPQHYPGMGVEFCNITVAMQKKLAGFVDKNADTRSACNHPPL